MNVTFELTREDHAAIADQIIRKTSVTDPMHAELTKRVNQLAEAVVGERFTKMMLGATVATVLQTELEAILSKEAESSIRSEVHKALNNPELQTKIYDIIVSESRNRRRQELESLEEKDNYN